MREQSSFAENLSLNLNHDKMFEFCLPFPSLNLAELKHSFESVCYFLKAHHLLKNLSMLIPWFTVNSYTRGWLQNLCKGGLVDSTLGMGNAKQRYVLETVSKQLIRSCLSDTYQKLPGLTISQRASHSINRTPHAQ